MLFWKKRSFHSDALLSPDEVFLDSTNMPGYARERFEGVLERPLNKNSFRTFAVLLFLFIALLAGRAFWLQVVRGEELAHRAVNNFIEKTYLEPPRGIIYDRNGVPIVFNEAFTDGSGAIRYRRSVRHPYAFSHVVGFTGRLSAEDIENKVTILGIEEIGKSGLERQYDARLHGAPGENDRELDAAGNVLAEGLVVPAREGDDITTTLHAGLQEALWESLSRATQERGFLGGAGIVFAIETGEIFSLVSVPSFDLGGFSRGLGEEEAEKIFTDTRSAPLFNRALSGAYAPGSIIKPFLALAALEERIIDPNRSVYSSGSLSVPDPYRPGQESVFLDWKAHGYVDMRRAIAVSSNVYFFTVGGGYDDIPGLGIVRIKDWLGRFGFDTATHIDVGGEKTGFLPDPAWKEKAHPENPAWHIGDTYNASIGQGDITVTPIAVARALAALARDGSVPLFHFLREEKQKSTDLVAFKRENIAVVREGMQRAASSEGTAAGIAWLPFSVAAKTGTAEFGRKDRVHSWFMGYTPLEHPTLGIVVFMESGPRSNAVGATSIASDAFHWILNHGGIDAITH